MTDFNNSVVLNGGIKPSSKNTPGDIRTRIDSIADVANIPVPFVGMLFYVIDENKYYKVLTLKGKEVAGITMPEMEVDTYEELLVGVATEEAVAGKVDKEEGKGLIDLEEAARLANVDNYNDTEVKEMIAGKADAEHAHEEASVEEVLAMWENMQEQPAPIEDVVEEAAVINVALVDFKADVYNKPAGSDLQNVDMSAMYVAVQLPEDEEYAMADKVLKVGGKEVPQQLQMSVGNNNFVKMDQFKVEGNEMKVAMPTILLADEATFAVGANGFKDAEFAVQVPAMQESIGVVKKHATFEASKYNVVKVADGEYNIELLAAVEPPSWSTNPMVLLLFDLCNVEGLSLIDQDSTFITKKEYSYGAEALGMTGIDNMPAVDEEAKPYLAFYLPVKEVAYDLKYKAILVGAEYKCMNLLIHVPANM